MEVVEGQAQTKVEEYLDNIPLQERVKEVTMDIHEPFRQAVQMCLPQAKVVVAKFHLVKHINGTLDKVRSRPQEGNKRDKRRCLFKNRYTLLKGVERLIDWEKERLSKLSCRYPELKRACMFKESFRGVVYGNE